jgi:Xaa-Pro dipeptidase
MNDFATNPIFSGNEIRRRWEAVLSRCPEVDCVIAPSFWNSYYLSGLPMIQWGRFAVTVLFKSGDPVLVVPEFEAGSAARMSPIEDVRLYTDSDGPALDVATAKTAQAIRERGAGVIGFEAAGMPAAMYRALSRELRPSELVDVGDAIDEVRMVSSDEELVYMRLAADAASAALRTIAELIGPGVEESQLAAEAQLAMQRLLPSDVQATSAVYMQQGERSIDAHARALRVPIRAGEFVEICCECEAWYYQAAIERALIVGELSADAAQLCETMAAAFEAACDAVRTHVTFSSVDAAARRTFESAGYSNGTPGSGLVRNIIHHTGGRIPAGNIQPHNNHTLAPGMVLTVEPWTLVPGVGAPRHCDTLLVTDAGHERLTEFARGVIRV